MWYKLTCINLMVQICYTVNLYSLTQLCLCISIQQDDYRKLQTQTNVKLEPVEWNMSNWRVCCWIQSQRSTVLRPRSWPPESDCTEGLWRFPVSRSQAQELLMKQRFLHKQELAVIPLRWQTHLLQLSCIQNSQEKNADFKQRSSLVSPSHPVYISCVHSLHRIPSK